MPTVQIVQHSSVTILISLLADLDLLGRVDGGLELIEESLGIGQLAFRLLALLAAASCSRCRSRAPSRSARRRGRRRWGRRTAPGHGRCPRRRSGTCCRWRDGQNCSRFMLLTAVLTPTAFQFSATSCTASSSVPVRSVSMVISSGLPSGRRRILPSGPIFRPALSRYSAGLLDIVLRVELLHLGHDRRPNRAPGSRCG